MYVKMIKLGIRSNSVRSSQSLINTLETFSGVTRSMSQNILYELKIIGVVKQQTRTRF